MTSRGILNAALLPYKVNMNVVTPLVNKVVEDEGGSAVDITIVHVIGAVESPVTVDVSVATIWEKVTSGKLLIVERKDTASSPIVEKYYPVLGVSEEGETEKAINFYNFATTSTGHHSLFCWIDTNTSSDTWFWELD